MELGPPTELPGARLAGISLFAPYLQNLISGNHIERDAQAGAQPDGTAWSAVSAEEPNVQRPTINVGGYLAARLTEARTLVVNGAHAFINEAAVSFDPAGAAIVVGSCAALRGNVLVARGSVPAVSVSVGGDIQFGDNRCELRSFQAPAVALNSTAAVVSSNIVRGGQPSLVLTVPPERVAVLGNATTSAITVNQNPLTGTQWAPLNILI